MATEDELGGRVTPGAHQAVLDRINEPFAVNALSVVMPSMKAFAPEPPMKAFLPEMPSMKVFASEMSAMSTLARKAAATTLYASSALQDVVKQVSSAVSTTMDLGRVTAGWQPDLSAKAFLPEMPPMRALASETSAIKARISEMSAMSTLARKAAATTLYASSALQDTVKQLSSTVSKTMDLGRVTADWLLDLPASALQSAVRAYQPDLSAPYFTKALSLLPFEVPSAWTDFGRQLQGLQGDVRSWLTDIQARREAAARLWARRRAVFSRVIEFRKRAIAWLSVAHPVARIRDQHNLREAVFRALAAKRAEIAYGRAQLAHREVSCMSPGRLVAARPHLTNGPNSCKSIRTHRLAGPLHA